MLETILADGFGKLGINPDAEALPRYHIYYEYLEEINKVMNLTAISGEEDVARLHFLDCAAVLTEADLKGKRAVDVGTGAGFPGLALKIACPEMKLTLLDSLDKRINFLKDTCAKLGFSDVECIHARAEEAPKEYRESFDFAFSRAVARLNLLSELCLPMVKTGGAFIAMKGPDFEEELNEAKKGIALLGGKVEKCVSYTIPDTDITHSLIIIRKLKPTPPKYPRRWAQIKKQPL
ncbi:MAG: 16S rRNA (guanine(527)-N(7))-methyltransferase RsmG [Eubacteriales bacterium]|nr:16S rRNA (guanine(527)-N(7))-methyltransferase RsmG [Eubacteriales bacterium]